MTFPIALVIVLVLAGFALMPKKTSAKTDSEPRQSYEPAALFAPQQAPQISLREQQVAEESTAVADLYRRKAHNQWMLEMQAKAANMFGEDLEDA